MVLGEQQVLNTSKTKEIIFFPPETLGRIAHSSHLWSSSGKLGDSSAFWIFFGHFGWFHCNELQIWSNWPKFGQYNPKKPKREIYRKLAFSWQGFAAIVRRILGRRHETKVVLICSIWILHVDIIKMPPTGNRSHILHFDLLLHQIKIKPAQ